MNGTHLQVLQSVQKAQSSKQQLVLIGSDDGWCSASSFWHLTPETIGTTHFYIFHHVEWVPSSVVIGKPIRTEIGSGIFSSGSVQNGSEPFSSKEP